MAKKTEDAATTPLKHGDKIDCPRCASTEHAKVRTGPSNALEVWCDNCKMFQPIPA